MESSRSISSRASILDPDNISFSNNDEYGTEFNRISPKLEDEELKRLSKYFEQSREELQKVVFYFKKEKTVLKNQFIF